MPDTQRPNNNNDTGVFSLTGLEELCNDQNSRKKNMGNLVDPSF